METHTLVRRVRGRRGGGGADSSSSTRGRFLGVVCLVVYHTPFEGGSSGSLDVDVVRVDVDNLTLGCVRLQFPFDGGLVPVGVMVRPYLVGLPMVLAIAKPSVVLLHEQNKVVPDLEVDLLSTRRGVFEAVPKEPGLQTSGVSCRFGDRLAVFVLHIAGEGGYLLFGSA